MPLYDYRCQDCGHTFESRHGMSEPALTSCPVCPGHVQRLISKNVMVSFKGAGFYSTDSKPANETTPKTEPAKPETPASPSPEVALPS